MYTKGAEKAGKGAENVPKRTLSYAVQGTARDGGAYSCDKVQLVYRLRYGEAQGLLDALGRAHWLEFEHWESKRPGTYRNQFRMLAPEGRSYWLGVGLNEYGKGRASEGAKLEWNPNKVGHERSLAWLRAELWSRTRLREPCEVKAWDLAIDWPAPRETYRLRKDARLYEEHTKSASDCTQYVGQRNAPGRCKLYNKQAEAGLASACTRLELTLAGGWRPQDVARVWPVVYRLDDYQATVEAAQLTDTDRFILATLLDAPERLRELGRRKATKMRQLLEQAGRVVEFDAAAFAPVAAYVARLALPDADREEARPAWEWVGQPPDWVPPDKDPFTGRRAKQDG